MSEKKPITEIDQNRLDEECVSQPRLYMKYATELADAKFDYDEAKARFDVAKAEIQLDVRDNPEEFGLKKVTEATIEAAVIASEAYQTAQKKVNQCKHAVALLEAAVGAIDHKKRMLENLVTLHGQNYFSQPKPKGMGKEQAEEYRRGKSGRVGVRDD